MQYRNPALYATGAAAVALVLYALGVELATVLVPLVIIVCPLMMFFMMRGMGGSTTTRTQRPKITKQPPR